MGELIQLGGIYVQTSLTTIMGNRESLFDPVLLLL